MSRIGNRKLTIPEGVTVSFNDGIVTVKGAKVKATVVGHGKAKKVVVFKYKPKKNERKVRGKKWIY